MNTLSGYGYSAPLPPGFNAMPDGFGGHFVIPPNSSPPPMSMALIWLRPVAPMELPMLIQTYYAFDNPMVAMSNAYSLGMANVLSVAPLRQSNMNGATAYVREFDAVSLTGQPTRMSAFLLQGPNSALQAIVGINVYQWAFFAAAALQFVAGIQLVGTNVAPGAVRAYMDHANASEVQLQVVNADHSVTSLMSMPAEVDGKRVVNVFNGPVYLGDKNEFSGNFSGNAYQFGSNSKQSNRKA